MGHSPAFLRARFAAAFLAAVLVPGVVVSTSHAETRTEETFSAATTYGESNSASADEPTTSLAYSSPDFDSSIDFRSMLSRILMATVLVLVGCAASAWLAKQYLPHGMGRQTTSDSLRLLATLPVSRRGCIQLLQAEQTKIVVAIDGGSLKSVIPLAESFGPSLSDAIDQQTTGHDAVLTSDLEKN